MADYLSGFSSISAKKAGWIRHTCIGLTTRQKDYEFVMNGFRKLKTYALVCGECSPSRWERSSSAAPICGARSPVTREIVEERNQQGERFWWYVCTGPKAPYATLSLIIRAPRCACGSGRLGLMA